MNKYTSLSVRTFRFLRHVPHQNCENGYSNITQHLFACNTLDVTLLLCISNSYHVWLCDMLFPPWLGFVFCLAFCSCHPSHLMASCALHLHVFIKLTSVRSFRVPPLPSLPLSRPTVNLLSDRLSLSAQPPTTTAI